MRMKENKDYLLKGTLWKAILMLAIPIAVNNFIQTMYNLTDSYWLGKIGTDPQSAITVVTPIQSIIVNFGTGITVAGAILISQYLGAKDEKNAKSMVGQLFASCMIFSVVCAAICFLLTPALVGWLAGGESFSSMAVTYLRIVILDMPFLFTINIFTAVNQSQGDTVRPMFLNLLGIVLNMILDPLFMLGFGWGVAGAALATLLAKVPCAIIALYSLCNNKKSLYITKESLKIQKDKLKSIAKIGLPTAIGGSTMQLGFLLMTSSVIKYGSTAVSAYGIGNRVNGLVTMPANAMGSAVATIVGQCIGARDQVRAQKAYLMARRIAVIFLFIGGLILSRNTVSEPIVRIFSNDPDVIRLGTQFLQLMAFWCFTNGIYTTTNGLHQGSGHTMINMTIDATRLWVFRLATLFICERLLHMGVQSIWYAVVVSNGISAVILWIIYKMGVWKKQVIS
ncbi:MATE family efflux transporter [Lachnoclostridium phytofermentans]|uniref:MATE efflux family protein n=1 Tax=Lachnoclostridium phytofermentans (strain ATCC 700394 / DSM 18823 / ISDg) TaxID=357809 RepID=A9KHA1_LACP7|nr:MATE family efflux transporter [Lachnoclostridium phytofermentans]ABX40768.1 MATE efflux family protein [Lachnoclostridium phytofermentans ISDg]